MIDQRSITISQFVPMVKSLANSFYQIESLSKNMSFDDLVSLGMSAVDDAITKYNPDREPPSQFSNFVFHKIRWVFLNQIRYYNHRKRQSNTAVSLDELKSAEGIPDMKYTPDIQYEKKEEKILLQNLIKLLPPKLERAIQYKFYEDLTLSQIGQIEGISKEAVRQRLNRAYKLLRIKIKKEEGIYAITKL